MLHTDIHLPRPAGSYAASPASQSQSETYSDLLPGSRQDAPVTGNRFLAESQIHNTGTGTVSAVHRTKMAGHASPRVPPQPRIFTRLPPATFHCVSRYGIFNREISNLHAAAHGSSCLPCLFDSLPLETVNRDVSQGVAGCDGDKAL